MSSGSDGSESGDWSDSACSSPDANDATVVNGVGIILASIPTCVTSVDSEWTASNAESLSGFELPAIVMLTLSPARATASDGGWAGPGTPGGFGPLAIAISASSPV
jgi:hypothetical protein